MKPKRSPPLEILERIVRNLPIVKPAFYRTDTPDGTLYFAIGKEAHTTVYHGVWGFTHGPGIAQTIQFSPDQSRRACINHLVEIGTELLSALSARGMLRQDYWRG